VDIFEQRFPRGSWSAETGFWQPASGRPLGSGNPLLAGYQVPATRFRPANFLDFS